MNRYKVGDSQFKKGSNLHKAYAITCYINTAPEIYVHSERIAIDLSIFMDSRIPKTSVYGNWSDMEFAAYPLSKAKSQWWNPETNSFAS